MLMYQQLCTILEMCSPGTELGCVCLYHRIINYTTKGFLAVPITTGFTSFLLLMEISFTNVQEPLHKLAYFDLLTITTNSNKLDLDVTIN